MRVNLQASIKVLQRVRQKGRENGAIVALLDTHPVIRWNLLGEKDEIERPDPQSIRFFARKAHEWAIICRCSPFLGHSIRPISIDGYIRKAETDDFILFGESPRADLWTPIPVRQISELEYLGQEVARDRVCERVRLIL